MKCVDYFDTFAFLTRISSNIVLILLGLVHNLVIHEMSVKIAFFNDVGAPTTTMKNLIFDYEKFGFVVKPLRHQKYFLNLSIWSFVTIFI